MVLGVTNPFFIKTFQNWPHVVRLGEIKMAGKTALLRLSVCLQHRWRTKCDAAEEVMLLPVSQVIYPNR